MQSQNLQNGLCFQGKPFNITVIQVYTLQQHWRSWSWTVLWRPTRSSRTNTPNRCPFHSRGLECKSRKSRNTWSNRQIWPWSTEWSKAKANRVLPRERTGHSKHPFPTQEKTLHMDITRWSTPKSNNHLGPEIFPSQFTTVSYVLTSSKLPESRNWILFAKLYC